MIPPRYVDPPDRRAAYTGRPVFGRTVAGYYNSLNHLIAFRGLRHVHQFCDFADLVTDGPPAGAMGNAPRMRWVVSPAGQYLWWGAFVAAEWGYSGATIDVRLETVTGVLIEEITFDTHVGELPALDYENGGSAAGLDKLIHTGWALPGGLGPHLFDLDGYQGQPLQLRCVTDNVRIFSHFAVEAYVPALRPVP